MFPGLVLDLFLFLLLVSVLVLFLLAPAILEIKKPKDSGPRIIEKDMPRLLFHPSGIIRITNIDKEPKTNGAVLQSIAGFIELLPNLEA